MKPVSFEYVRPATVREAISILGANPDAKILAGGQTLGPMLNLRLAQPTLLVDITRIPQLVRVDETADVLTLGACITHASIEDGRVPDIGDRVLARVARGIAYRAVRSRGTIGGSLAHADPAADWLSLLSALDACLLLHGRSGERAVPLTSFVTGPMMTDLAPDDLVVAVRIPKLNRTARIGYNKICRKTGDFADAIGVAVYDPERKSLRLVAGSVGGAPIVIDDISPPLAGQTDGRAKCLDSVRSRLQSAGLGADVYELSIHTATLQRALDEVLPA
jgi:aerobic carbon-monoxide dehydrogenase medium subunit